MTVDWIQVSSTEFYIEQTIPEIDIIDIENKEKEIYLADKAINKIVKKLNKNSLNKLYYQKNKIDINARRKRRRIYAKWLSAPSHEPTKKFLRYITAEIANNSRN